MAKTETIAALKVEQRKVEELIPYARNARTHSDKQVAHLAGLIREFGWTNPILIDGDNGIIAGHGRLAAARKLGLTEVPVIELKHLTPAQKRAYILADNKAALNAGWDSELLTLELADLKELDLDMELTGFELGEIDELLALPKETTTTHTEEGKDLNMVIQYNIIFDDIDQQQIFYGWLRELKNKYPDAETAAARITAALKDLH